MDALPPPVEGGSPMLLGSLAGTNNHNSELILKAAQAGNKKALRKLKDKGAIDNVDVKNADGQTALFIACFEEHDDCVQYLLELGANANEPSQNGQTPLHAACYKGSIKAVSALIEHGGDFRFHDKDQRTAKDWAMMNPNAKKRQPMIEYIVKTRMFAMTNSGRDVLLERQDSLYLRRPTAESGSLAKLFSLRRGSRRDSAAIAKVTSFMSLGYGKVYGGNKGGTISFVPVIAEAMLRHDDHATTFVNGAFFVMESMTMGHTRVTVKRLHHNPPKGGIVDHLIMECDNIAHLRHPNVLLLMATCYTDNMEGLVLVFERIQFGSLYSYLHDRSQQPQTNAAVEASLQIAEGLIYIHQSGFLHCGLTSHAMFLTCPNTVKIGNFEYMVPMSSSGLALRHSGVTQNRYLHAVYNWLSPEVVSGELPTEKSDLYSFCCIMWEIFTAFIPWSGYDADQVTQQVCAGKKMLCVTDPRVPAKLSEVLTYGLQPNPANRKMSLEHVRDVLYLLPRGKSKQQGHSSKPNMQPSSSAAHINNHCSSTAADLTIERYEYISSQSSDHELRSTWEGAPSPIVRFKESNEDLDEITFLDKKSAVTSPSLLHAEEKPTRASFKPAAHHAQAYSFHTVPGVRCLKPNSGERRTTFGAATRPAAHRNAQQATDLPTYWRRRQRLCSSDRKSTDVGVSACSTPNKSNDHGLLQGQLAEELSGITSGMLKLCDGEKALLRHVDGLQRPATIDDAADGFAAASAISLSSIEARSCSGAVFFAASNVKPADSQLVNKTSMIRSSSGGIPEKVAFIPQQQRTVTPSSESPTGCESSASSTCVKTGIFDHLKTGNPSTTSLYDSDAIKPASHSTSKELLTRSARADALIIERRNASENVDTHGLPQRPMERQHITQSKATGPGKTDEHAKCGKMSSRENCLSVSASTSSTSSEKVMPTAGLCSDVQFSVQRYEQLLSTRSEPITRRQHLQLPLKQIDCGHSASWHCSSSGNANKIRDKASTMPANSRKRVNSAATPPPLTMPPQIQKPSIQQAKVSFHDPYPRQARSNKRSSSVEPITSACIFAVDADNVYLDKGQCKEMPSVSRLVTAFQPLKALQETIHCDAKETRNSTSEGAVGRTEAPKIVVAKDAAEKHRCSSLATQKTACWNKEPYCKDVKTPLTWKHCGEMSLTEKLPVAANMPASVAKQNARSSALVVNSSSCSARAEVPAVVRGMQSLEYCNATNLACINPGIVSHNGKDNTLAHGPVQPSFSNVNGHVVKIKGIPVNYAKDSWACTSEQVSSNCLHTESSSLNSVNRLGPLSSEDELVQGCIVSAPELGVTAHLKQASSSGTDAAFPCCHRDSLTTACDNLIEVVLEPPAAVMEHGYAESVPAVDSSSCHTYTRTQSTRESCMSSAVSPGIKMAHTVDEAHAACASSYHTSNYDTLSNSPHEAGTGLYGLAGGDALIAGFLDKQQLTSFSGPQGLVKDPLHGNSVPRSNGLAGKYTMACAGTVDNASRSNGSLSMKFDKSELVTTVSSWTSSDADKTNIYPRGLSGAAPSADTSRNGNPLACAAAEGKQKFHKVGGISALAALGLSRKPVQSKVTQTTGGPEGMHGASNHGITEKPDGTNGSRSLKVDQSELLTTVSSWTSWSADKVDFQVHVNTPPSSSKSHGTSRSVHMAAEAEQHTFEASSSAQRDALKIKHEGSSVAAELIEKRTIATHNIGTTGPSAGGDSAQLGGVNGKYTDSSRKVARLFIIKSGTPIQVEPSASSRNAGSDRALLPAEGTGSNKRATDSDGQHEVTGTENPRAQPDQSYGQTSESEDEYLELPKAAK